MTVSGVVVQVPSTTTRYVPSSFGRMSTPIPVPSAWKYSSLHLTHCKRHLRFLVETIESRPAFIFRRQFHQPLNQLGVCLVLFSAGLASPPFAAAMHFSR